MSSTPEDVSGALTAGIAFETGAFTYEVGTDRWQWSDEVFRMHGFEPGEVVPTTAMILAHKHPEDRERYAGALERSSLVGGSFASLHRILDANGDERILTAVGESRPHEDGSGVKEVVGHFVDVTDAVRALASAEATRQIEAAQRHRAVIDQAMGVIAARTGLTPGEAFDLLRAASMRSNVKLHTLAQRVLDTTRTRAVPAQAGDGLRSLGLEVAADPEA